ncbi:MAG: CapA family protein [Cellulosilyticum sp.]|nr:CapA family protein [Cellulosilyticum sp.]
MKKSRWISILLILAMSFTVSAKELTSLSTNIQTIQFQESYRKQKVTYVPANTLLQQLGYKVSWEQAKKRINVNDGSFYITLESKKIITKNGNYMLSVLPEIKEGRMYIPLNFFATVLGYNVTYKDGDITISGKGQFGKKGKYDEIITKKRITISAAGDFTLGYYKGQASGERFDEVAKANGYNYFMKNVKSIFETDDLTIVNLEGPLTTRGTAKEKEFAIRGLPDYTKILTSGSIETVNLANNHTYDYGNIGYTDTVVALNKEQIGYFGEDNTYYTTINDINVAVLGANGWVSNQSIKNTLKKRIDEAKKQADLIIVEFHWGIEREHYPNSTQQDLAKYVVDQGAHLVLGSHPHVIQGIGSYKGANIVYSMGNFCFGANKNPADKDTFIYQETFALTADGIVSEGYEVIPCRISSSTSRNNYQPTILEGKEKARVLDRLETYSKNLRK